MAASISSSHKPEATFKNYSHEDAAKYAKYRPAYNPKLIELAIDIHRSSGGQVKTLLDVGCGPALSTRQLCVHFEHVIGVDASPSMIETAEQIPCPSSTGEQASFSVCNSEDIDKVLAPESVDLITVATAAHWFDMPRFYAAASKILKPNGSIAMWCGGSWYAFLQSSDEDTDQSRFSDPRTTPNAARVQEVWNELELEVLRPFEEPGNKHCRELYENLPLPWTVDLEQQPFEVAHSLKQFDENRSVRREFNKNGQPDNDPMFADSKGFMKHAKVTLDQAAMMFSTASQVTRWRQAHKEEVEKGELEDCVAKMMRITKEEIQKGSDETREWIEAGVAFVLLVIKKRGPES